MSFIRGLLETRYQPPDVTAQYGNPAASGSWGAGMVWQGSPTSAPSTEQAMRLSAVFACFRLISEAIATLPLDTFYRSGGIRRPFRPRPAYLSFDPPGISRVDYLSQVVLSLLSAGNAYVLTVRDRLGEITDLVPLDPASVTVKRQNGRAKYLIGDVELELWNDIIHFKGMCMPGSLVGLSPIAYAAETIGLGLNVQRFGSAFFDNGALPAAVIETPGDMSQAAAERFAATWHARHAGVGNASKVGVLTNGAKLNKVSLQPNDSQFIETRAFQVPDIARIFGVPPHLIADASNSTSWGSGLQEQNLAFGQFSLRPWLERIEDVHTRLLSVDGQKLAFVKLNLDALLRASLKDRYDAAAIGINSGFLTINEQRALEDLAPVPWGNGPAMPPPAAQPDPEEGDTDE